MIAHNADPSNTWTRTINRFTDRTEAERKAVRGARLVRSQTTKGSPRTVLIDFVSLHSTLEMLLRHVKSMCLRLEPLTFSFQTLSTGAPVRVAKCLYRLLEAHTTHSLTTKQRVSSLV